MGRVFFTFFATVAVVAALLPSEDGMIKLPPDGSGSYADGIEFRFLGVALAALLLGLTYRGRIQLRDGTLVMRYLTRTRVIPVETITSVKLTRTNAGLLVETTSGRRFSAPVFVADKGPLATWFGRRAQADDIVAAITAALPPADSRNSP